MSDRELIIAAAEKVMGWKVVPFSWEDRSEDIYPRLIENINGDWILCAAEKGDWNEWNPLASDADAFTLVDALKKRMRAAFVLGSNGCSNQYTAWVFDGIWALGHRQNAVPDNGDPYLFGCDTSEDRRRAIVLACLRAVGVEA